LPPFPVPDINAMEGHATKMAQLSEQISSTLRIMNGSTAGPSGLSGASETITASSRRADAECFAQMSNQFFDKLNSTHMSETSLLENIQATFQRQNCENVLANERERRLNSQLFKDMA
jgi:Mlc titration factor MtfA (ptsG expression regulator)